MRKNNAQLNTRLLIMYMISALLFLVSVDLHIHTQETAATAAHGFAVDISSLADNLLPEGTADEISVSPDSALHTKQSSEDLLAVFLLITVLLTVLSHFFIGRLREVHTLLSSLPFHGAPSLRAPPL